MSLNSRSWATHLAIAIMAATAAIVLMFFGLPLSVGLVFGGVVLIVVSMRGGPRDVLSATFRVGIGLSLLYVLVFALVEAPTILDLIRHRTSFDPASWRRNSQSDPMWPARLTMVDDLLRSRQLHGMSRQEVVALLGRPDETTFFRDWSMVYWLGPERSWIRIDSEWLVIRLDESGRVTEHRLIRD